jgi:protein O-mannosyl-transferase
VPAGEADGSSITFILDITLMTLRLRTIIFCLVLVLISSAVFEEVRTHQFVFDDLGFISRNSIVKEGLTWKGFAWAFTTRLMGIWHPVTWLSHMMDCQLFGVAPAGHHLMNLFFHIVNSILLFLLLKFCTGAEWPSFIVAALFAAHPLHVESVAWVAERKDVLSALFWLLTMWAYVWYVRNPGLRRYALVLVYFCLGLMAKPMLVTLPLVLLLWDYWPLKRWASPGAQAPEPVTDHPVGDFSYPRVSLKRLLWEKTPLFILALLFSLVAVYSQNAGAMIVSLADIPLDARISNALVAYVRYLGKIIVPLYLTVFYPHPGNVLPWWQVLWAAFSLALLSFLIIRRAQNYPYLLVGWLWFLGTLLPVIGLVQIGTQAIADRYTYIPLIGLFIMLAWGMADLLARWRCPKFLLPMVAGIMIVVFGTCAWFQVAYWRNAVSLFQHALSVTKNNALAQGALGEALYFRGEVDQAMVHFQEAMRLDPPLGIAGLAWVMATTSNPKFRNGAKALELARMVNQMTCFNQPELLDVLAAAYSEVGNFSDAVSTAQWAAELARASGRTDLAREIQQRLALYQQDRPYRDEAYETFQK